MMQAFRLGLHPLHAIQALTRGGLPVADAVQAVALTRAALRNPAKTGILLTAKALGLPALPCTTRRDGLDLGPHDGPRSLPVKAGGLVGGGPLGNGRLQKDKWMAVDEIQPQ